MFSVAAYRRFSAHLAWILIAKNSTFYWTLVLQKNLHPEKPIFKVQKVVYGLQPEMFACMMGHQMTVDI